MDPSSEELRQAGEQVLNRVLADEQGAAEVTEVVRTGAALLLRRSRVLVRVRPADRGSEVAHREVQVATLLEELGVPVTTLVQGAAQPWTVDGCLVTAWAWSSGGDPIMPRDLGLLARTLRVHTADVVAVPVLDPIEAALDAVAHLPADDPEASFIRDRAADLAAPWAEAAQSDPLGRAVVHGDLHHGNVVASHEGPLLTDLELVGSGPPSYDAAPAVVGVDRYGTEPATAAVFLEAFGADPREWSGFATFVAVYELWVTAWAVGVRDAEPAWATEASNRVATLRDGADHRWYLR
ncbi:MAG: aminoglycoside phosphotransferase family protein [Acidimicrobiia bacterium]|nr:aminoglycoside phosphotransferase family protein [Acidimicrobiia bacterium]